MTKSRVWIIDPVDGTREYGEVRADWAVHVGLTEDGAATVGAVALPGLGLVLRSDQPAQVSGFNCSTDVRCALARIQKLIQGLCV